MTILTFEPSLGAHGLGSKVNVVNLYFLRTTILYWLFIKSMVYSKLKLTSRGGVWQHLTLLTSCAGRKGSGVLSINEDCEHVIKYAINVFFHNNTYFFWGLSPLSYSNGNTETHACSIVL